MHEDAGTVRYLKRKSLIVELYLILRWVNKSNKRVTQKCNRKRTNGEKAFVVFPLVNNVLNVNWQTTSKYTALAFILLKTNAMIEL